jgi:hypothetical protein
MVVPCICAAGFVGSLCDVDEDGCATNPCHTGVACLDVPVHQLSKYKKGFICDQCPPGLDGDGEICTGICSFIKNTDIDI